MLVNAISDIEYEIVIAKHNLWVAKTVVEDKQKELSSLESELKTLQEKAQRNLESGSGKQ